MASKRDQDLEELARALNAYLGQQGEPDPAFLDEHADLRQLLEPLMKGELAASTVHPSAGSDDPLLGRTLADFRLFRRLGRGGMGAVYEAQQLSLGRRVALKVLASHLGISPHSLTRFKREGTAGARLQHAGLVAVFAVGEIDGVHYIAQELVEGGRTLARELGELRSAGSLPGDYFRKTAERFALVADALHAVHEAGILHRDVKPGNILLTADGRPKVGDFGLARIQDSLAMSRTGDVAGTPYYMSPEQVEGRPEGIDRRSDVFSLGATLFEALTLVRAFDGDTAQQVMRKITEQDPPDPRTLRSRIPRDLAVICLKALRKSPAARYASMADFAEDLRRYLTDRPIQASPPSRVSRAIKWSKRHAAITATVLLGLSSLAVFVALLLQIKFERDRALPFTDRGRVTNLQVQASQLWPPYPENVRKYEAWLSKANELLKGLPKHKRALDQMSLDHPEPWLRDNSLELVAALDALEAPNGGMADIQARLEFARAVEKRTVGGEAVRQRWAVAIESIADDRVSPKYHGLRITPQLGLVPLARNEQSGLWEFWLVQSGAEPEPKDPAGDSRSSWRIGDDTGLVFVLLPGGKFWKGRQKTDPVAPNYDPKAREYDGPVREENVEAFFLSRYEMTQGQWFRLMGNNPSRFRPGYELANGWKPPTLGHPVEQVTWYDCQEAMRRLGLRLPSDSEWEYGARSETSSIFWMGDDRRLIETLHAGNLADGPSRDCEPSWPIMDWLNDGYCGPAPVDAHAPNLFGLHGTIGNVYEWCETEWRSNSRICRGGSYMNDDEDARAGHLESLEPGTPSYRHGLRPARSVAR